jgi:hypothetical protein
MNRRKSSSLAARPWPVIVRASSANGRFSEQRLTCYVTALRNGVKETDYFEDWNLEVEYRRTKIILIGCRRCPPTQADQQPPLMTI